MPNMAKYAYWPVALATLDVFYKYPFIDKNGQEHVMILTPASVFTGFKNTMMPRSTPIGWWELVSTLVLCLKHKYAASLISESARAKTMMPSYFPIGRPGLA